MTSGKVVSPALSPAREKTDTRGRAAILIVVNTFDPKVRSGQLTNCNQRCNRAERVRCDGGGVGGGDGLYPLLKSLVILWRFLLFLCTAVHVKQKIGVRMLCNLWVKFCYLPLDLVRTCPVK